MGIINAGIRKGIKAMAVVAQTAQFVSLMPKPKDFVTRIVGDVVYLSAKVIKLSDDLNSLLDSYADIPSNYLMTQMNSITGSLSGITDRVSIYGQNAVNQVVGLGENAMNVVTELTGSAIDTSGAVTNAIISLGAAVAETSANMLGNTDMGEDIHDATEVVLEWSDDGFKNINTRKTDPLRAVTQKLTDYKTGVTKSIDDKASAIKEKIDEPRQWLENLITELREKMDKLCNTLDTGFKDVTGLDSVSTGASKVAQALKESDNNSPEAQATTAAATAVSEVIKNFSIGKMAMAFTGLLTQAVIVKVGLDKLPPIDFESMMCKIRSDLTVSSDDLYKRYNDLSESAYNDYIKFGEESGKITSDDRNYTSKNYNDFINEFDEDLRTQRDEIRIMMKTTSNVVDRTDVNQVALETKKKAALRSAIHKMEKYRKKINRARNANNKKSVLGEELINFKKEVEYRCNSLKADWKSMMDQYKKAISEIKVFFSNGGACDMFINDCCDAINHDFDEIKSLCKNLISQLVGTTIKVAMPADIGSVVPNPVYKIADFIMDIKTILKFIKDLITLIIDIINHINKLARIILNGINNLNEIIKQLMDIVGLRWLMNLIQSIIDLFGDNIMNARERLENTLSPVHFSDTDEYNNTLDALDELMEGDGTKMTSQGKAYLSDVTNLLSSMGDDKDIKSLIKDINSIKNKKSFNENDAEKIDGLIEDLEKQGDTIVAYKSPIIKKLGPDDSTPVSSMIDGVDLENDIKFIGWHFFHPNLNHTNNKYYSSKFMKKIKSKIIKKASKTGHKRSGGVNRLRKKNVGNFFKKRDKAYVAFYWYTYYTEDLEKDCFERTTVDNSIIIDNVVHTENGSVVELNDGRKVFVADNMVRSGDYVNVDGVKYRVK